LAITSVVIGSDCLKPFDVWGLGFYGLGLWVVGFGIWVFEFRVWDLKRIGVTVQSY